METEEVVELRSRLAAAEAALAALRCGEADALSGPDGVIGLPGAEKPYLTFFDAMNEGGLTLDSAGRILHCNPRFAAIVDLAVEALRGRPLLDRVVPVDRARAADLLAGSIPNAGEVCLQTPGGEPRPVRLSLTPLDARGQRMICAVVTDLRERVAAEEQLRKLSLALEQGTGSIMITATDGRIEYVNETFVRLSGYNREEVVGHNPRFQSAGRTPRQAYVALWQALLQGHAWQGEFVNRRKDGSEYVEFAVITPLRQPDGRITHYVAVKEDVTEKKRLARELEGYRLHLEEMVARRTLELSRQTHSLRALIDNVPHMAWLKDCQGQLLAVNRAFAEANGMTPEQMPGKTDFDLWPREIAERYRADDALVMTTWRPRVLEEPFGSLADTLYETHKAPIVDADGAVLGTVGYARDVKPQRAMEAELARRAQQAEAANYAKSAFLANMSHEIRTPLNGILGMAHVMAGGAVSALQAEQLGKIASSGKHLLGILNDILDLSKIEAGRVQLEHTDFLLTDVLDNVAAMIGEAAQDKGLSIEVDRGAVPAWLHGDVTRLRQALLNYAGNAVKFTESGGISLRARLLEQQDQDLHVRFEVEDSGIGIAAETLGGLFQAFEQADASTTRKYGGTGLGLTITRRIAQLMGGEVGAESRPGVGSRFWFTARLQTGRGIMPADSATAATQAEASAAQLRLRQAGTRLLLAEDNALNREVALAFLHSVGLILDTADDGREALAKAAAHAYPLILMDVQMPNMDGLAATRAIRALPGHENTVILAMTASAFEEDRRACRAAGMNDFVSKPVDPEALCTTLLRWLPPRVESWRATISAPPPPRAAARDHSATTEQALLRQRLARIAGLEIERGLVLVSGDVGKCARMLGLFAVSHGEDPARIAAALAAGDRRELKFLAHTLKGSAANIGAMTLAERAAALDSALRLNAGKADVAACGAALGAPLGRLCADIRDTLSAHDDVKLRG